LLSSRLALQRHVLNWIVHVYEAFYGLSEKPFSILPDPEFLYWASGHEMAYSMLEYGVVNQAGITVITGEIGCGKTTLVRQLLRDLDECVTVGLVANTIGGRSKLLNWVMMSLNQPYESRSYVALYQKFQEFLIEEYGRGRYVILIIDEAQNLGVDALEELRMLSNINADKDQLLQLILIGQPQLRDLLRQPKLVQFAQRVSADYHLRPLGGPEVAAYIDHRLTLAGATRPIFSRPACELIASASKGIPRTINILCDTSLVYGFSANVSTVGPDIVSQVLEDKRQFGVFSEDEPESGAIPFPPRRDAQ
jgi:general secretion pathway protein A